MNELLSTLDEPPREVDQIAVLRQFIRDPQVRLAMSEKNPQTLADAYAAAVNAMTAVRTSRAQAPTRTPTTPKPQPRPPQAGRGGRHGSHPRPPHGQFNPRPPFHARPSFNHMMMPPTMQYGTVAPRPQLHTATMQVPSPHTAAAPTPLQAATASAQLAAPARSSRHPPMHPRCMTHHTMSKSRVSPV